MFSDQGLLPQEKPATSTANGTFSSNTNGKINDGPSPPINFAKRVLSYFTLGRQKIPASEDGSTAESLNLSPPRPLLSKRKRTRSPSPSPGPQKRRSTRAAANGNKAVDYDMKHHPMDDILRPKAAAKRSQKLNEKPRQQCCGIKTDKEEIPSSGNSYNPFNRPIGLEWEGFEPLDRRIYILQKGAPTGANTLSHTWPQMTNLLVKQRFFTRTQFQAWGGVEGLIRRYEHVRLRMQTLFAAESEPSSREHFPILYAENFDVYDLEGSNTKYVLARKMPQFLLEMPQDARKSNKDLALGGTNGENQESMDVDHQKRAESTERGDTERESRTSEDEEFHSAEEHSEIASEGTLGDVDARQGDISQSHRDEVYEWMNEFCENQPEEQESSQISTIQIHPSDEGGLPKGFSTAVVDNEKDPSLPDPPDGTEEQGTTMHKQVPNSVPNQVPVDAPEIFMKVLEKGQSLITAKPGFPKLVTGEIGNLYAESPKGQNPRKQRSGKVKSSEAIFQVFEDQADVGVSAPTPALKSTRLIIDLPKENIDERGEFQGAITAMDSLANVRERSNTTRRRDRAPQSTTNSMMGPSQASRSTTNRWE